MADEPSPSYYCWDPKDLPDGVYTNPHFGELTPGRVVEVRDHQLSLVAGQPDWKKSNRKQFESQAPISEEREQLRQPKEEE
jgi:hypothetical protein